MTGDGEDTGDDRHPFDAGETPLGRLYARLQALGDRELVAASVAGGLAPLVVGAAIAAAGGFVGALLSAPLPYVATVGLTVAYLTVGWAVTRYSGVWTAAGDAFDVPDGELWATVQARVDAMADARLLVLPAVAFVVALAFDLATGIRMLVYVPAAVDDHHLLLALVNYGYGVALLPVLSVGPALVYHHVKLVETVADRPLADPRTAAGDLAPLSAFGTRVAAGMVAGLGVFAAHLLVLVGQLGHGPAAVPVLLATSPVVAGAVLLVVGTAAAAFVLPERTLHAALVDAAAAADADAVGTWPSSLGRRLLGDRRPYVVLAVVLVVVAVAGWGLFVHQPGAAEETELPFAENGTVPADDESYRIESQVVVRDGNESDGAFVSQSLRVYHPDDPSVVYARQVAGSTGDSRTQEFYASGDATYERQSFTSADRYEEVRGFANVTLAVDGTRTFYDAEADSAAVEYVRSGGYAARLLGVLRYEEAGTDTYEGRTVTRYVPAPGWYVDDTRGDPSVEGPRATSRIRAASGEVLVDRETGVPLYADVEATTVEASTWWEALTGETVEVSVEYAVTVAVDRPGEPPWVDDVRAADATNATGG